MPSLAASAPASAWGKMPCMRGCHLHTAHRASPGGMDGATPTRVVHGGSATIYFRDKRGSGAAELGAMSTLTRASCRTFKPRGKRPNQVRSFILSRRASNAIASVPPTSASAIRRRRALGSVRFDSRKRSTRGWNPTRLASSCDILNPRILILTRLEWNLLIEERTY